MDKQPIIKEVREMKSDSEVNKLLESGWKLRAVNTSSPCTTYVMIRLNSD